MYQNIPKYTVIIGDDPVHNIDLTPHKANCMKNSGFAASDILSPREVFLLKKHRESMPSVDAEFNITKLRYKNGHLEVLMTEENNAKHCYWISPSSHPIISPTIASFLAISKLRIHGSPKRMSNNDRFL